jgi:hypothetical protein
MLMSLKKDLQQQEVDWQWWDGGRKKIKENRLSCRHGLRVDLFWCYFSLIFQRYLLFSSCQRSRRRYDISYHNIRRWQPLWWCHTINNIVRTDCNLLQIKSVKEARKECEPITICELSLLSFLVECCALSGNGIGNLKFRTIGVSTDCKTSRLPPPLKY